MRSGVLRLIPVVLFSLSISSSSVSALEVPDRPQGYVTDQAALLTPSVRGQLNQVLRQFEASTSIQVVVASFSSLEQESLEDFSIRLAQRWKVGQKGKDNGVILIIFKAERLIRIEVGYGLEGALPDILAGTIIRNDIAPFFKQEQYEAGVLKGVQSIMQAIKGEYRGRATSASSHRVSRRDLTPEELAALKRQGFILFIFVLIGASILFLADIWRYFGYRKERRLYNQSYSFWEWFFRFAVLLAVASIVFRILFYMMLFSRGGYGGGRGGGGFSGGGGSFGGGGASGSW